MGLKSFIRKLPTLALAAKYAKYYKRTAVDENVIFYSSHQGAGMLCGPYAMFRELMESRDFDYYTHVWQINDAREKKQLKKELCDWTNVRFVKKNSRGYFKALTGAKYLFINNTLPFYFTKKLEQVYVNTWHGIPLKTLGYDVPDGKYTARNMTRNFLLTDFLISPCRFMTKIYLESYKLGGIYTGKLLENGYPRNDMILSTKRDDIIEKLINRGIAVDDKKKIILAVYVKYYGKRLPNLIPYILGNTAAELEKKGITLDVRYFGEAGTYRIPGGRNLGQLTHEELAELYGEADFGMVASMSNISLVPYEMQATGLPLIEFKEGTYPFFFPENTALLASINDRDISELLLEALEEPGRLKSMNDKAAEYMKELSWERTGDEFYEIIHKAYNAGRA